MTSWTVNVLNSISCPRCHGLLRRQEFRVECAGCGSGFETRHNLIDLCPDLVETDTLAQRAMESRAVSKIYERVFRPALTLLAGSPGYEEEESWLRHWFRPTAGPILDLACGTGRYTRMLIRRHDQPVIGVDVSWQMLRRAAARGGTYVRASAQALPVADDTLGGINCFGALHLFPDPGTAIAEFGRSTTIPVESELHRSLRTVAETRGGAFKPTGAGVGDIAIAAFSDASAAQSFRDHVSRQGITLVGLGVAPRGVAVAR